MIKIGLLEFGLREHSMPPMDVLEDVINHALEADSLGYTRFWLTEHHNLSPGWNNPEMLLPIIAGLTENIRIGKFVADSSLAHDRVIAPREFDNSHSELISKQLTVDATHSTVIQNDLQEAEYRKSITDLEQQQLQQDDDYRERIGQNIKKLRGEFAVWAQKYLIRSPVDGKAVFFGVWKVNQYVNAGEGILIVVPPIQDYIAKAMLPVRGAGKVKIGQRVYIKLAAYPYQEFGVIKGTVAQISPVPLDTIYSMEISLDNKLRTNIDKEIPAQAQLTGTAEVLTNNKSIFKRLFENIWVAHKK